MNSGLVTLEKSLKIQDTGAGEVGQWLEHVGSHSQEGKGFPSSDCIVVLDVNSGSWVQSLCELCKLF